jgi:hypothetical protein
MRRGQYNQSAVDALVFAKWLLNGNLESDLDLRQRRWALSNLQVMTTEPFPLAIKAALLCCGYKIGYYKDSDIESWAVRQIDTLDEPPLALIELMTVRDKYPIDVMNLLKSLGGVLTPSAMVDAQIGFLGLLYDSKRITVNRAIGGLFKLVHDAGVTDEQQSMIYWLDDRYDLAVAGTYGTIEQVESELNSFMQPYREKLKAQEVEMLGEGL